MSCEAEFVRKEDPTWLGRYLLEFPRSIVAICWRRFSRFVSSRMSVVKRGADRQTTTQRLGQASFRLPNLRPRIPFGVQTGSFWHWELRADRPWQKSAQAAAT